MGRERQKKKNRSSVSKVRTKLHNRTKAGRKKVNFLGNETIAANWDRKLTLQQNYKRLGLSSRLRGATGGVEKTLDGNKENDAPQPVDSLALPREGRKKMMKPEEVRVERDPETGHILQVVQLHSSHEANPLNDPLNDSMEVENEPRTRPLEGVVEQLEAEARAEEESLARKKRPRQQSQREEEWLEKLHAKYGDNTHAMARDRKLNPMQQSEGDIKRRLRKWISKREDPN